jgi:hypothetical protein
MKNETTNCLFVDTKELVVIIDFLGERFSKEIKWEICIGWMKIWSK